MRPRAVDDIPEDMPLDRGVTIMEAADILGCDPTTLRRMLKRGELTSWRVAAKRDTRGATRISLRSIEDYKHRHANPIDTPAPRKEQGGRGITNAHKAAVARLLSLGIRCR